jgi:ATP-dependent DNA helicase RecG
VKIYDHSIEIFNPGKLPEGLSVQRLLKGDYVSTIRNRKIADMFKEAGLIEKYGTGIRRILQGFNEYGLPAPEFEEIGGGFRVTAYRMAEKTTEPKQVNPQVSTEVGRLLSACVTPKSRDELQRVLGLSDKKHFRAAYLKPSLEKGLIELTVPDKPRSRLQRYRLTEAGRAILRNFEQE